MVSAHRFSFKIKNGKIPEGLLVLHKCDNPPCVNPKHLFLGTSKDNTQDSIRKRRRHNTKGEGNGNSKLTKFDTEMIRSFLRMGITQKAITLMYDIAQQTVSDIKIRRSWK